MQEILNKSGFICDMDGVIYRGSRVRPGVPEFINWMQENGKKLYAFDDRICRDALSLAAAEIAYTMNLAQSEAKKLLSDSWAPFAMLDE